MPGIVLFGAAIVASIAGIVAWAKLNERKK